MGRPGLLGLCILGRRYREGGGVVLRLRSKDMSVPDKPWEGPTVEMR